MQNFNNPPEINKDNISLQMIKIAFPTKYFEDYKEGIATLCVCHNQIRTQYYECPICKARVCDAPSTCPVNFARKNKYKFFFFLDL